MASAHVRRDATACSLFIGAARTQAWQKRNLRRAGAMQQRRDDRQMTVRKILIIVIGIDAAELLAHVVRAFPKFEITSFGQKDGRSIGIRRR
jgi:hypothetical protein